MINIVENTLRDGSYVVDFQFDRLQTSEITKGLSELGFDLIEIGHGLGLGAWSNPEAGLSKEKDEDYIISAVNAAPKSRVGVFFIPGIGSMDDIDMAVDLGVKFIRVGTNVDSYKNALKFVEHAKKRGIFVAVNLMKSYAVRPYEFTKISSDIDSWRLADVIYLVDSAGCMLPSEVHEYIERTREIVATPIGFHGHNNMSLAIANSLKAIEAGATYIDTCIRGMGRSAGNAQTEILVYLLQKMGLTSIDTEIYDFYDFAKKYVSPIMPVTQGLSDEEIHIGISKFHSSFTSMLENTSERTGIDKLRLMKMVSDINCINPSESLFSKTAIKIQTNE